jgi:hypothetical protein
MNNYSLLHCTSRTRGMKKSGAIEIVEMKEARLRWH